MTPAYTYSHGERRPVEILVFKMDPSVVEEFLAVDHKVWTLGEAFCDESVPIPFLSKEVWIDETKPGQVTIVFIWDTMDDWMRVGQPDIQKRLQAEFDSLFPHELELIAAPHEDSQLGLYRIARFERTDVAPGEQTMGH